MMVELDEADRQATLLALAILSLKRPGWLPFLRTVAAKFGGGNALTMFEEFRKHNEERKISTTKPAAER